MYDIEDYSDADLVAIGEGLQLGPNLLLTSTLQEHRAKAQARFYYSKFTCSDEFSQKHGLDIFMVKDIRHRYTNYDSYWKDEKSAHVRHVLWMIGFMKVSRMLAKSYPELLGALDYESVSRIALDDHLLLRDCIFSVLEMTTGHVPAIPLHTLREDAVSHSNKYRYLRYPEVILLDTESSDPQVQRRINEEVLRLYIGDCAGQGLRRLAVTLLDPYNRAVAKERYYTKALDAFGASYPEMRDLCEHRKDYYSAQRAAAMNIVVPESMLSPDTPALSDLYRQVMRKYDEHGMTQTIKGWRSDLSITEVSPVIASLVRSLTVGTILDRFSVYPQLMVSIASMPDPNATVNQNRVRAAILGHIQERYPDLSETVEAELRLLPLKPEVVIAS